MHLIYEDLTIFYSVSKDKNMLACQQNGGRQNGEAKKVEGVLGRAVKTNPSLSHVFAPPFAIVPPILSTNIFWITEL